MVIMMINFTSAEFTIVLRCAEQMCTVDHDEYAVKLFLYTSVGVCGRIYVKTDRNSSASKKVAISRILL